MRERSVCLSTIVLLLLFVSTAVAADWVVQSPHPAQWNLKDVAFVSPTTGFLVGTDKTLLRTVDGGASWQQTPSVVQDPNRVDEPFNVVDFADPQHGWVFGNHSYRTGDGGDSWQVLANAPLESIYHARFFSPDTGYIAGNGTIYRTDDGGDTFTEVYHHDQFGRLYALDWRDQDTGAFFGGNPFGLFMTTNAGASWSRVQTGTQYDEVRFLGGDVMLATDHTVVYRSTDLGQSWQPVYSDPDSSYHYVVAIELIGADSVMVLGNDQRVWLSNDRGISWTRTRAPVGGWGATWGVDATATGHVWIAGHNGLVYRSADGALTWAQASRGMGFLTSGDLRMFDNGRGITVGQVGTVLTTNDFGAQWTAGQVLADNGSFTWPPDLYALDTVGDNVVAASGEFGSIFLSDDAGRNWNYVGYPRVGESYLYDIDFVDAQRGYVFGQGANTSRALIYYTADGGATWTLRFIANTISAIFAAQMLDENNGWACGDVSACWRTNDGWNTVDVVQIPYTGSFNKDAIGFATMDTGWVVANFGYVARTTDGGDSWTLQTLPGLEPDGYVADIVVHDELTAWVATGVTGVVYRTIDGGENWERLDTGYRKWPDAQLTALDATSDGRIWATGYLGVILASDPPTADIDGDGIADPLDTCPTVFDPANADTDFDGVGDACDNCSLIANTNQRDSNADGFGNLCDADFNDDCLVNFADLEVMKSVFFSTGQPDVDLDGDGVINFADLDHLKTAFFGVPGPSGLTQTCTPAVLH